LVAIGAKGFCFDRLGRFASQQDHKRPNSNRIVEG
jgi:hypothetical protein